MKKQFISAIAIIFSSIAYVSGQNTGDFPVPLTDPAKRGKLDAHINSGSITVRGTARKDVLVKYATSSEDENSEEKQSGVSTRLGIREHRGEGKDDHKNNEGLRKISSGTLDLEVSENSNHVEVHSNAWSNNLKLEIEIPSGFDLKISTYNDGDLVISNVQGELELTNYNGEITAESISGSIVASTYNGEIKAVFDKTTDGAPMSFSTYNGDIDLTFPAAIKASLKMRTDQGEILTGFDVALMKTGPVQKRDGRNGTFKVTVDEWVKGDINGGGAELSMKTYNGDIKVRKK